MFVRATLSDDEGRLATVDGVYSAILGGLILAPRGEDIRPQCRHLRYLALIDSPAQPAFEPLSPVDLSALVQPGQWEKNIAQVISLEGGLEALFQADRAQEPRDRG